MNQMTRHGSPRTEYWSPGRSPDTGHRGSSTLNMPICRPRVHGARINGRCKIEKLSCTIRQRRGEVVSHSVFMHVVSSHADALSRASREGPSKLLIFLFASASIASGNFLAMPNSILSSSRRGQEVHTRQQVACLKSYAAADHVVNVAPAPRRFNSEGRGYAVALPLQSVRRHGSRRSWPLCRTATKWRGHHHRRGWTIFEATAVRP